MHAVRSSSFRSSCSFIDPLPLSIEPSDCLYHLVELGSLELRVDGQRDDFPGCPLALRKCSLRIPEIGEARLQVERQRIVDRVSDPFRAQVLLQRIAALDTKS